MVNLKEVYGEYLEHSIRYYILDRSVVSDTYFDDLCRILLASWGDFEHRHKNLCDESALFAGSGYQLSCGAPIEIVNLCRQYPDTPLKEVFKWAQ